MKRLLSAALIAVVAVSPAAAQRGEAVLMITNASPLPDGAVILRVYARPQWTGWGDGSWGHERLGSIFVGAQSTIGIRIPGPVCVYDVRLEFNNGFVAERSGLDLCVPFPVQGITASGGSGFRRDN